MQKKLRSYVPDKYRRVFIAEHDSNHGARIGGKPPEGVAPACIDECTRYFATVPLNDDLTTELSIFISFDNDSQDCTSADFSGKLFSDGPVRLVVHDAKPRRVDEYLVSEIPSRALIIEESEFEENGVFAEEYEDHKIGGLPAFEVYRDPLYSQVQQLLADGYSHIVQFSFPNRQDAKIGVSWPFMSYIFHVFGKEIDGELKLLSCWK